MILAAGRGERMRPLTDHTPKPLLKVAGTSLIEHHLIRLKESGFKHVVINHSWLGQQIVDLVGNGRRFGLSIKFSAEPTPLETAGGIVQALPLIKSCLGDDTCFAAVNGDIFCDIDFASLPSQLDSALGYLVLVDNPPHNSGGDFSLHEGRVIKVQERSYTYSGVAVYHVDMFKELGTGKLGLRPLFDKLIESGKMGGVCHSGIWFDIGTPQRLAEIDLKMSEGIN